MASNQIERISCGFYENTAFDEQLLDVLNKISPNPRLRGQKIKELAWEYIKANMPNEITPKEDIRQKEEVAEKKPIETPKSANNIFKKRQIR